MKVKQFLLIALAFVFTTHVPLNANTLLTGNDVAPDTFTVNVRAIRTDNCTGDIYTGLDAGGGTGSIAKLPLDSTTFNLLGTNPLITGVLSACITIPVDLNKPIPFFVAPIIGATPRVNAVSPDGAIFSSSPVLNDGVGAASAAIAFFGTLGGPCVTTNEDFIFAIARGSGGGGAMPDDSGLSVTRVTPGTLALDTINANTGVSGGNFAVLVDRTTTDSAGNPPRITAGSFRFGAAQAPTLLDGWTGLDPMLLWDERLQRLYMSSTLVSDAVNGNGVKGIASISIASNGVPTIHPIVPDAAIVQNDAASSNNMIGARVTAAANVEITTRGIAIMHTSTGFPYIIFNGGPGVAAVTGDRCWALPLINDPNATTALFGTVCDNTVSTAGFFDTTPIDDTPLDASGDLAVLRRAEVGAGRAPLEDSSNIAQLEVIGDSVYMTDSSGTFVAGDEIAGRQPGIWRSQAQFDHLGRIVNWTPWEQVHPINLFGNSGSFVFSMNSNTGTLIASGAAANQDAVRRTDWNTGAVATDLATNLNTELSDGAFSALDLGFQTRGFGTKTGKIATEVAGRYTLFGGNSKVVFIRNAIGVTGDLTQQINGDFTAATATNFLSTTLPGSPGPVRVLEYSRRVNGEGAQNYFFAGTSTGLFAFAATAGGGGFTADNPVSALNAAPFTVSSWQKVGLGLEGLDSNFIVDVKTQGQTLYCITCERVPNGAPHFRLLNIPFAATIGAMFVDTNISVVADSLVDPEFADVASFNGMQIFTTGDSDGTLASLTSKEQLCIATNNGLFHTRAAQGAGAAAPFGSVTPATSAAMLWTRYPGSDGIHFTSIAGTTSRVQHTVWPVGSADDALGTFERSRVYQTSGNGDTTGSAFFFSGDDASRPGNFDPDNFNAETPDNPDIETVGLINNFWTDGTRRLFSVTEKTDLGVKQTLRLLPFQTGTFCAGAPTTVSDDPAFAADTTQFNDCTMTGWLGELVVLTDKGVASLS